MGNLDNLGNKKVNFFNSNTAVSIVSTTYVTIQDMVKKVYTKGQYLLSYNSQLSIPMTFITTGFSTSQAKIDVGSIITEIEALPVTGTHLLAYLNETITAGVYTTSGATTMNGNITFDGQGSTDSVFVIRAGAAFSTGANANIILLNGASAENIHIVANGAIALGVGTSLSGNLISKGFAISTGVNCSITGRMLTTAGALAFSKGGLAVPLSTAFNIDYLTCINLVMFTGAGGVSNSGRSIYNGDIATDVGAITGFNPATVNGTIFPAGSSSVVTEFNPTIEIGFFKNDVLIPYSERTERKHVEDEVPISLMAEVDCSLNDEITVKARIDNGVLTVTNRFFSTIRN